MLVCLHKFRLRYLCTWVSQVGSQLRKLPLTMSFFLLLWIIANLGIASGQDEGSRPKFYLLEIPQTPTDKFIVHSLSSISFAKLTILAGYHLSWSRRQSTDACSWTPTPFVRILSMNLLFPKQLWRTCDCHCDYRKKSNKKINQKQLLFMSLWPGHGTKCSGGEGRRGGWAGLSSGVFLKRSCKN